MSKPVLMIDPTKITDVQLMDRTFFFQGTYTQIKLKIIEVKGILIGVERCSENGFKYPREYMYLAKYNNMYLLWDCHDYWYPVEG